MLRDIEHIKKREGFSKTLYKDVGKWAIGYGHNLTPEEVASMEIYGICIVDGITQAQATFILNKDVKKHDIEAIELIKIKGINPEVLSDAQLNAICDWVYQLGPRGVSKFNKTWEFLKNKDYAGAAKEAADSLWYKQTPKRVEDFQQRIIITR